MNASSHVIDLRNRLQHLLFNASSMPPSGDEQKELTDTVQSVATRHGFDQTLRFDAGFAIVKNVVEKNLENSAPGSATQKIWIQISHLLLLDGEQEQDFEKKLEDQGWTPKRFFEEAKAAPSANESVSEFLARSAGARRLRAAVLSGAGMSRNTFRAQYGAGKAAIEMLTNTLNDLISSPSLFKEAIPIVPDDVFGRNFAAPLVKADLAPETPEPRRAALAVTFVGAVVLVALLLQIPGLTGSPSNPPSTSERPDSAATRSSTEGASPATKPSPSPSERPQTIVSGLEGCPQTGAGETRESSVEVDVLYWCTAPTYDVNYEINTSQWQVKLRPTLLNASDRPISVSISNPSSLRLLVDDEAIDERWQPPPVTASAGDRPIIVICDGKKMWAVPPNVPSEEYELLDGFGYLGHATYWDLTELGPGEEIRQRIRSDPAGRIIKETNLVFNVPSDIEGNMRIYGFAVIDPNTRDVLGVAYFDSWKSNKYLPGSF